MVPNWTAAFPTLTNLQWFHVRNVMVSACKIPCPTYQPLPQCLHPLRHLRHEPLCRLSNQEYQDLRNKGLCFRCKQPYSPLQECLKKEVRALLWGEDKDINIEDFEALELDDTVPTVDPNAHLSRLELPLYSVGGISGPRMMKLHGFLNGTAILVMIDSGASYNFLS